MLFFWKILPIHKLMRSTTLRNGESKQSVSTMPSETQNTSNSEADEINKNIGIYIPPHLRNGESKQSASTMSSETEIISPVTASCSSSVNCNWTMNEIIQLLKRYTKYKPKLSHPGVKEQTVWKRIALNYNELECHKKIDELRCEYERIKNENVINRETAMFLDEAKKAFETTKTTEKSKVKFFLSLKKSNEDFLCKLLHVYAKYKTELVCPNNEEQKFWEKIAKEMREKFSYACGETLCRFELLQLKCQYESLKRDGVKDGNMVNLFHDAKGAFETTENLVTSSVNASSSLSEQICNWNKKRTFKLLKLYAKYKTEFSLPDIEEQTVWKKIALELQNCDELQCCNKIDELRCEYERIKNKNVTNRETAIFLHEAKKAFETTETTEDTEPMFLLSLKDSNKDFLCKLLIVYAKYKTELTCSNNEEQKFWKKIAREMREKFSYACGETLCRFELLQLKCQYERLKRYGEKSENMTCLSYAAKGAFETSENPDNSNSEINEINKRTEIYVPPPLRNRERRQSVSTMSSETESIPPVKLSNLPPKYCKWKQDKCLVLLQAYAIYRTELSRSSIEEKFKVWKKIAEEVCQRGSFECNELQCRDNIKDLRREYFALKHNRKTELNEKTTIFFNEAENAFGTSRNSNISPAIKNMRNDIKLLRRYTKNKPELSHPYVEEQTVWKKIASKSQSESECRNKLDELRCKYEKIKNENVTDRETAMFLDEAKKAFETTETTEQPVRKFGVSLKRSNKEFLSTLLQVYTKYKTELASPNTEEQNVWEKIAREVTEISSYICGARICRFELLQLKCQYENLKKGDLKNGNMPLSFDEAREAFEDSEKLDRSFTIKVSNLSENVEKSDLEELFGRFGIIAHIYGIKDSSGQQPTGFAFIKFYKEEDATRAIKIVNGYEYDKLILKVEWAEPSEII